MRENYIVLYDLTVLHGTLDNVEEDNFFLELASFFILWYSRDALEAVLDKLYDGLGHRLIFFCLNKVFATVHAESFILLFTLL